MPIIFWKKEAHTIQQNEWNFSSVKNLSIWCHSRLLSNHIVSSIVRLSFVVQKAKVKPQQNILYCIHNCYALYVFLTQISQRKSLFISKSSSTVQMQKVNWFGVLICNYWKNKRFLRIFPGLESKTWLDRMFNNSFHFLWWENIFPVAPSKWAIVPLYTAWKVSKYGVFLVRISLYLDRIRRFTP